MCLFHAYDPLFIFFCEFVPLFIIFFLFFLEIFAIIAFAIFVGKVEDQIETDSKIWEYSWSFALFTTGWTVACCCGPTSKTVGDEDN